MRISDWSSDVCSSDLTRCCGSQPVSAVAEPLSSSALRKAWETKGLSPAQASHAAAGTSAMRLTTFTARLSLPGRKSTRLTPVTNAHLVCRLLLEKKKTRQTRQHKNTQTATKQY